MPYTVDGEHIYELYRQDIKEKKATGRGAFHKKGGSKSKKCNFPSDYMTRKEKQALNGEVMSYNPNAWYTWEEFKALPMEYQVKYVNSLLNRYNCGLSNISEIVFGKSKGWLGIYFKKVGQMEFINHTADRHLTRELYRNGEKLKADMEKSRQEIQNESFEVTLVGGGSKFGEEASKEYSYHQGIKERIDQAAQTVKLYESRGMKMTPELINQIYEEKTGMSFALAMEHTGEPIGKVEESEDEGSKLFDENSKEPEDSTDAYSFSITMNSLDQDVINYIRDLFGAKDILVKIEVHQIK